MERLRPDEWTLLECLTEYYCLKDSQLRRYLKILRKKADYDIAIRNLRIRQYIFCGGGYVAIEPKDVYKRQAFINLKRHLEAP